MAAFVHDLFHVLGVDLAGRDAETPTSARVMDAAAAFRAQIRALALQHDGGSGGLREGLLQRCDAFRSLLDSELDIELKVAYLLGCLICRTQGRTVRGDGKGDANGGARSLRVSRVL